MRQILVIHGGDFFDSRKEFVESLKKEKIEKEDLLPKDEKRWKDNFVSDLGDGFEVLKPDMPNFADAKYVEWKIWFEKTFPFISQDVILIGHSLGGIFLARYLNENIFPKKIRALFLVAAPFFKAGKKGVNANAGFTIKSDLKKLEKQIPRIVIYHSSDDPIVNISHAKTYKKFLSSAKLVLFNDKGHFRQEHFPELINDIKGLFA